MILRLPEYYKKFKCIADRCTDNCCIGWEIDIDRDTDAYYRTVEGDFGKRLKENIKDGVFVLCGERCPFLNEHYLCDIITTLGEKHLCTICAEHPRYYGWYGNVKEGGIGLCCEEAARIILTDGGYTAFYETGIPEEDSDECDAQTLDFLCGTREEIFRHFEKSDASFGEKLCAVLGYAEEVQGKLDSSELEAFPVKECKTPCCDADTNAFVTAFEDFEPIDQSWTKALDSLKGKKLVINGEYLINIFIYFIWRYYLRSVFDGDVISKVRLAAVSCIMISVLAVNESLESYINAAKLYSKEIEYNEENLELLLDMCYTESAFGAENLKSLVIE